MPIVSAIGKVLLDKTVEHLLPKVGDMIERGRENEEVAAAKAIVLKLASGLIAKDVLVLSMRCEHHPDHGLWSGEAKFVADVFNVSPVVLQVDDCFVKVNGWEGNPRTELFSSKRRRGKREAPAILKPGSHATIEFSCPVTMCRKPPPEWAAILVHADFEVELQGPTPQLCCTVSKGAGCWMPWRERSSEQ
jgi:hypothetical protein